jgi:hypothetical protein
MLEKKEKKRRWMKEWLKKYKEVVSYRKRITKPTVHTTIQQKRKKKNNVYQPHNNTT